MEQNLYGLTGAKQDSGVRSVLPVDFAAEATDFETVMLTWDETDMEADVLQIKFTEAEPGVGTVETIETNDLLGTLTSFTDYKSGDIILVEGETPRIIDIIIDDTHLSVTIPFENTAEDLGFAIGSEFEDLTELLPGEETFIHEGLTEETTYLYKMRVRKKFKWSAWDDLITGTTTPVEEQ